VPKVAQDKKRPETLEYSLDILNRTEEVSFVDHDLVEHTVYVSVYVNEKQKVFEVSDEPSEHIFVTEKDKKGDKSTQLEELKYNDSVSLSSSIALTTQEGEESKGETDDKKDEEENKTSL